MVRLRPNVKIPHSVVHYTTYFDNDVAEIKNRLDNTQRNDTTYFATLYSLFITLVNKLPAFI